MSHKKPIEKKIVMLEKRVSRIETTISYLAGANKPKKSDLVAPVLMVTQPLTPGIPTYQAWVVYQYWEKYKNVIKDKLKTYEKNYL